MNRGALVLIALLVVPLADVGAQNALQNSAVRQLEVSVRFDDDVRVDQRVRTVDGGRATILVGPSRPAEKRQYIQTPLGPIPQQVTVVQEHTAAFEVVTHVLDDQVNVQSSAAAASGRIGEWFKLGAVNGGGATRTVWIRVDEVR